MMKQSTCNKGYTRRDLGRFRDRGRQVSVRKRLSLFVEIIIYCSSPQERHRVWSKYRYLDRPSDQSFSSVWTQAPLLARRALPDPSPAWLVNTRAQIDWSGDLYHFDLWCLLSMVYLSHHLKITRVGLPYSVQGTRDTWVDREQSLCQSFDVPFCLDTGASACTSCAPVSLFSTTGYVFPSHPDADHLRLLMISIQLLYCFVFRPKRGTYGAGSQKSCSYARTAMH